MIQPITILPQDQLMKINEDPMHMALAHLVGAKGYEEYTEFYKRMSDEGKYIIMDNGVIENAQQDIETILLKAKTIGADEIILPDVFLDSEQTIVRTTAAWDYLNDKRIEQKFMIVPQGNDVDEYLWCLEKLLQVGIEPHSIGIPKVLTKLYGRDARIEVLQRLNEVLPEDCSVELHLLGCHNDALEIKSINILMAQNKIRTVRSVDSALPYVYARADMRMVDGPRPDSDPIDFSQSSCKVSLLEENIKFWRDETRGVYLTPNDDNVIKVHF